MARRMRLSTTIALAFMAMSMPPTAAPTKKMTTAAAGTVGASVRIRSAGTTTTLAALTT